MRDSDVIDPDLSQISIFVTVSVCVAAIQHTTKIFYVLIISFYIKGSR